MSFEIAQKLAESNKFHIVKAVEMEIVKQSIIEIVINRDGDEDCTFQMNNLGYSNVELKLLFARHIYWKLCKYCIYSPQLRVIKEYREIIYDYFVRKYADADTDADTDAEEFEKKFYDPLNKHIVISLIYAHIVKRNNKKICQQNVHEYKFISDEVAYMHIKNIDQLRFVSCYERRKWPIIAVSLGWT